MKTEKKNMAWGWIIFWIILVWPVGLVLLFRRFATDKSAIMSGKTGSLSVTAWILIAFGVLGVYGTITSLSSHAAFGDIVYGVVFSLVMLAGGILLLKKVNDIKMTAGKYKKYIEMVVNQNLTSIDSIASAVGLACAVVTDDLQGMINKGYLKDAYIHQGNREIVLKQHESVLSRQEIVSGQTPPQMKAVHCSGCGANSIVAVGKITECDYCGTPIEV